MIEYSPPTGLRLVFKIIFILVILPGLFFIPANLLDKTASATAGEAMAKKSPVQEAKTIAPIEENRLARVLARAENNFSRINTLTTRLIQEKNISLFDTPVISQGVCIFKSPDSIRLEYTTPFKSALIVNHGKIFKYEEFGGQWKKIKSGNQEITGIILSHIRAWLTGRFNQGGLYKITGYENLRPKNYSNTGLYGDKTRAPGITLILTPKAPDFKKYISAFELVLNKELNRLEQIVIREQGEDYTKISFSHDRVNKPVPDAIFDGSKESPAPLEYENEQI